MNDRMTPLSFDQLMRWAMDDRRGQGIFGLRAPLRYARDRRLFPLFSGGLEAPFGPAAGPHTQLAQNLLTAYAAGARFFELKTVQIIDGEDLPVSKPCITAADECYNCEWSTELRVPQAFAEYVRAWYAIKLLAREWSLGDPDAFAFNMSVGYDLAGIRSPKIDAYIEGMKDASGADVWQECEAWALANLRCFSHVDEAYVRAISPCVSESITLSTLHGCPPEEIERIATYLIEEKGLHTYVKCNPTLLGYEQTRARLDALGFDYVSFDAHHFREDLQFGDAVPMFARLMSLATRRGLSFGVKLTNTFPAQVTAGQLPGEEMYMSGRPLYALTIAVAERIAAAFDGRLRISYSGGADAANVRALYDAGIWPITMATTLLKPGGYARLGQIAKQLPEDGAPFFGVSAEAVRALASACLDDPRYHKPLKYAPPPKRRQRVPLTDCFAAPCRNGCPIDQDIPAHLERVAAEDYTGALRIIAERNPLPFITGTICPHRCMDRCRRSFYDESVHIREMKLLAATRGYPALLASLKPPAPREGIRVAIVGGGPAGIATAHFLARAGIAATVYEKRGTPGGIVRHVIPSFRIPADAIAKDVSLAQALGVTFRTGTEIRDLDSLRGEGYTHIVLACGAWQPGRLPLAYGQSLNVLDFLAACRENPALVAPGRHIAIIGGGNTAMDAARTALRLPGVEKVRVVYRRDRRSMPADEEELRLALREGVELLELLSPLGVRDGQLHCEVMALGPVDTSGRRRPVATGERASIPADVVIAAVGEGIDTAFFDRCGVTLDARGLPQLDATLYSASAQAYVAGDAHAGPATVVQAIADAMTVAQAIADAPPAGRPATTATPAQAAGKKGRLALCGERDARQCLSCDTICECCVDVCPNRANLSVEAAGLSMRQIIHVDSLCNACGNCEAFCPWDSAPYRDKLTLYWTREDFEAGDANGFLFLDAERGHCAVRLFGQSFETDLSLPDSRLPEPIRATIRATPPFATPLYPTQTE